MTRNIAALQALGLDSPEDAFTRSWGQHMPTTSRGVEGRVTATSRQKFVADNRLAFEKNFKGFASVQLAAGVVNDLPAYAKALTPMQQNILLRGAPPHLKAIVTGAGIGNAGSIGGNTANGVVPLVFDPDILRILKDEAPLLEMIPEVGQQGFKAVVNRIDARGEEIGFLSEADSLDLTDDAEANDTFQQIEVDMEIWADKVTVSDFARAAGQSYFDVRDTALGERVAQHAQAKERNVFYGDPSLNSGTGGFGDAQGYDGFAEIIEDAGNKVDKSAVDISGTDGLLKDIKAEIKAMLQSELAVSKSDLWIATSHTLFDELENEAEVKRRLETSDQAFNFGLETIRISGVPVVASHNIRTHTDNGNNAGDEGDVFIMNRREAQFRSLMPLSTVPLARVGLAETVALAEFGAPILRGAGELSRYLSAYPI